MPWQTIPTLAVGQTVTAAHLNLLKANADFLYGITTGSNWPFAQIHRNDTVRFTVENCTYLFCHRLRYLKFFVHVVGGDPDYLRIFYGGHKVWASETLIASVESYADLHFINGWPNFRGSWVSGTSYDQSNSGDGDIALSAGVFYKCYVSHTAAGATRPGVGASWQTVWNVITIPALGAVVESYIHFEYIGSGELALDYLFEDETPL